MPNVNRYMTREPYVIASSDGLMHAKGLMQAHLIRHLPVVDGGRLTGILSDRDVEVIDPIPGVDLAHVEVARVMTPPIEVWGETPIDEVSTLMANQKRDCVAVRGGQGIEGIFTA